MSQPNDHHYLPVFYLKRWAEADGRVWRYHRPRDRVEVSRIGPKFTAFEEGLYRLDGTADPQMIETKFFSVVDNDAAPVLERMIQEGPAELGEDKRRSWTLFLMSMLNRSPHSLVEIGSVINGFFRANLEKLHQSDYAASRQPDDPQSIYDFAIEQTPALEGAYKAALPDMIDSDVVGQYIINMQWELLNLSEAPHTLLTGDRPCMTSQGIADPACILSLPVSPTHLFVAVHDIDLLRRLDAQPARDTVCNSNDCTVKLAVQNIYGCTGGQLTFVEKRLRKADDPIVPGVILRGGLNLLPLRDLTSVSNCAWAGRESASGLLGTFAFNAGADAAAPFAWAERFAPARQQQFVVEVHDDARGAPLDHLQHQSSTGLLGEITVIACDLELINPEFAFGIDAAHHEIPMPPVVAGIDSPD